MKLEGKLFVMMRRMIRVMSSITECPVIQTTRRLARRHGLALGAPWAYTVHVQKKYSSTTGNRFSMTFLASDLPRPTGGTLHGPSTTP